MNSMSNHTISGGRIYGGSNLNNNGPVGDWYRKGGKRAFDVIVSLMALMVLVPILAVLGFIIFLHDRGKPFFVHKRLGQDGKSFGCIKLRSMVANAESRLNDILARSPDAKREWDETQKLTNDPRVTKIGDFLRKTSLDELPQLVNVLKGEMSLVGPRPIVRDELPRYGDAAPAYLSLRPGLTGLWQTTGRNDVSYSERVQMDVAYARDISLVEDLRIMVMTVVTMIKRTGK
ncbi:sugar transferase [Paracoccus sediminicola]|uniref:sugar transferase n=1 Tax=Paracoccus sediminicola TaxID=3017783 RepID=UPI0022F0B103|nr:sugar transferase [Paracoccus sediminicola]WBU58180.1 sugar transferase [Paracoccus sediminicola]